VVGERPSVTRNWSATLGPRDQTPSGASMSGTASGPCFTRDLEMFP
jgi:hypothetical protein